MHGGLEPPPFKPVKANTSLLVSVPNPSLDGVPRQRLNALEPLSFPKANDRKRTKTIPTGHGAPLHTLSKSRPEEVPRTNSLALRHLGAQPLVKKSLPLLVEGERVTSPKVCHTVVLAWRMGRDTLWRGGTRVCHFSGTWTCLVVDGRPSPLTFGCMALALPRTVCGAKQWTHACGDGNRCPLRHKGCTQLHTCTHEALPRQPSAKQ